MKEEDYTNKNEYAEDKDSMQSSDESVSPRLHERLQNEKVVAIKRHKGNKLKIMLAELKDKIVNMSNGKKATLVAIIIAGLILVIGTLSIIGGSLGGNENDEEARNAELFQDELKDLYMEIDDSLLEYSSESIINKNKEIEDVTEKSKEELTQLNSILNSFEIPVSSPVIVLE